MVIGVALGLLDMDSQACLCLEIFAMSEYLKNPLSVRLILDCT